MALELLSCVQSALISTGYNSIILKVKQVICLENLFLKKRLGGSASNRVREIPVLPGFASNVVREG